MGTTELSVQEQIEALEQRAEDLLEERIAVQRQIIELRGVLEGVQHVRVGIDAPNRRPEPLSPAYAAQITDFLEHHGGCQVSDIAEGINSTVTRVSDALKRLEALETVRRTGIKRGTKWWLAEQAQDASLRNPAPDVRDARALVRDIAVELSKGGGFMIGDIEDACDLSKGTILRWLRHLVDKGMLEVENVQTRIGDRMMWVKMYAYVEPTASPLPERKATPEEQLKGKNIGGGGRAPARGSWYTHMPMAVRLFVAELEAVGCKVVLPKASGHIKVHYKDRYVGTLPKVEGLIETNRRQFIENGVPLSSGAVTSQVA